MGNTHDGLPLTDVVIARGGASTLMKVTALGASAVFVPPRLAVMFVQQSPRTSSFTLSEKLAAHFRAVTVEFEVAQLVDSRHRFVLVVEKSVPYHQIGCADAMAVQLGLLLTAGALPAICVGIIPKSTRERGECTARRSACTTRPSFRSNWSPPRSGSLDPRKLPST